MKVHYVYSFKPYQYPERRAKRRARMAGAGLAVSALAGLMWVLLRHA